MIYIIVTPQSPTAEPPDRPTRPHSKESQPTKLSLRQTQPAPGGLEPTETASYITHHLSLAGRSDTLFSDDAVALIHQVSRGLPRQVNNPATQSLIAAFAGKKSIVDESAARAAVTEVSAE